MQPKSPPNPGRRKFLIGATSAVGAVGIAGAAVPTAPTADVAPIRNFLLPGLGGDFGCILPFRVLWSFSCFS